MAALADFSFSKLVPRPASLTRSAIRPPAPNTRQLLDAIPEFTCLLGVCEDNLPVLLDLNNPLAGAVIICADPKSGKTTLLQSILANTLAANPLKKIQYALLVEKRGEWLSSLDNSRKNGIERSFTSLLNDEAYQTLDDLAQEVERRLETGKDTQPVLVLIDGLQLIRSAEPDSWLRLELLLQSGPDVGVWPICSVDSDHAMGIMRWVNKFTTRIAGRILKPEQAVRICGTPNLHAPQLKPGDFSFRAGDSWKRFSTAILREEIEHDVLDDDEDDEEEV
jgi:hypothetical protein